MNDVARIDAKHLSLLWAGPERAAEISALHETLFDVPWSVEAVRNLLDHPASTSFIGLYGARRQPVAFIIGQLAADEAEILSIGVAKEAQRCGVGTLLVEGLVRAVSRAEAKRVYLEVAADNAAAVALYRGLGFKEAGIRKGYYERKGSAPVDALILALAI